jgi:hypothetical protein
MQTSGGMRRENAEACLRSCRGPSFETLASQAPQDEVVTGGEKSDPHGEETRSVVSNHEAPELEA